MRFENLLWCYTFSWIAAYRALAEQTIAGCDLIEATLRPVPMLTPLPAPVPVAPRRSTSRIAAAPSGNIVPFPLHRARRPSRRQFAEPRR
jgi:hypothetical protein